jgi:hypothetical protein
MSTWHKAIQGLGEARRTGEQTFVYLYPCCDSWNTAKVGPARVKRLLLTLSEQKRLTGA